MPPLFIQIQQGGTLMEFLSIFRRFVRDMGVWGGIVAPFLVWQVGVVLWIGFMFPLIKRVNDSSEEASSILKDFRSFWLAGLKRTLRYKWEIFFASVGGIILTNIYWFALRLSEKFLPSFLYLLVLAISSFILGILFFSKGNDILSHSPSTVLESVKYIWGGFTNPFNQDEVFTMK